MPRSALGLLNHRWAEQPMVCFQGAMIEVCETTSHKDIEGHWLSSSALAHRSNFCNCRQHYLQTKCLAASKDMRLSRASDIREKAEQRKVPKNTRRLLSSLLLQEFDLQLLVVPCVLDGYKYFWFGR